MVWYGKFCRVSLVSGAIVLLFAGTELRLEARTISEAASEFVIICFPGPPASDNRAVHYERIREANFNLVLPSYRYDDDQQLQMLDLFTQTFDLNKIGSANTIFLVG